MNKQQRPFGQRLQGCIPDCIDLCIAVINHEAGRAPLWPHELLELAHPSDHVLLPLAFGPSQCPDSRNAIEMLVHHHQGGKGELHANESPQSVKAVSHIPAALTKNMYSNLLAVGPKCAIQQDCFAMAMLAQLILLPRVGYGEGEYLLLRFPLLLIIYN